MTIMAAWAFCAAYFLNFSHALALRATVHLMYTIIHIEFFISSTNLIVRDCTAL